MAREDDGDIGFTFDPKPFLRGVDAAEGGVRRLGRSSSDAAHGMSKAFEWALLKVEGLKLMAKGLVGVVKQYVPELGKSFGIAKDIVLKNFLWPLRQAMGPYIQGMLNWVRDNRGEFVKWGQTAANVFGALMNGAKALWNAAKPILQIFTGGKLSDEVNLLTTKFAVVVAYLAKGVSKVVGWVADVAPSLKPIVDGFKTIGDVIMAFTGGVLKGFFDTISTPSFKKAIGDLADAFKRLVDTIFGPKSIDGAAKLGEFFGKISGSALKLAIEGVAYVLNGIATTIQGIRDAIENVSHDWAAFKQVLSGKMTLEEFGRQSDEYYKYRPRDGTKAETERVRKNRERDGLPPLDSVGTTGSIVPAPNPFGSLKPLIPAASGSMAMAPVRVDVGGISVQGPLTLDVVNRAADDTGDAVRKALLGQMVYERGGA